METFNILASLLVPMKKVELFVYSWMACRTEEEPLPRLASMVTTVVSMVVALVNVLMISPGSPSRPWHVMESQRGAHQ